MISGVFVLSLLSGGAASAAYASDNDDFYDNYETYCSGPYSNQNDYLENACNDIKTVRDSEAAAAVSYGVLLAYIISTYMIVIMSLKICNFKKRIGIESQNLCKQFNNQKTIQTRWNSTVAIEQNVDSKAFAIPILTARL